MSKGRTKYVWISLIFLHFAYLFWQVNDQNWLLVDSEDYLWAAENLREYSTLFSGNLKSLPIDEGNYTRRPPVYPFMLMLGQFLHANHLLIAVLQMFLSLLSFGVFLKTYRLLYAKNAPPFWILFFLIFYPAQYIYANLIMAETLFQFFLMLAVYFLLHGMENGKKKDYFGFSLCLSLAVLTKPVLYLLIPVSAIGFLIWTIHSRKWIFIAYGIIPLIVLALYVQRNQSITNYLHVSSVENINLLQYPVTYILAREYEPEQADQIVDDILLTARAKASFKEEQIYLRSRCMDIITEYPMTFIALQVRGMLNFFLDPGRFDVYHFFSIESSGGQGLMATFGKEGYAGVWKYLKHQPLSILGVLGIALILNLLKFLAFLLFLFNRSVKKEQRLILMLIILYIAGVTGVMGASRFAMPCFYLLLLMLPAASATLKKAYLRIKSQ